MDDFDETAVEISLAGIDRGLDIWIKRLTTFEDMLMDEYHELEKKLEKKKCELDQIGEAIGDLKLAKSTVANSINSFKKQTL